MPLRCVLSWSLPFLTLQPGVGSSSNGGRLPARGRGGQFEPSALVKVLKFPYVVRHFIGSAFRRISFPCQFWHRVHPGKRSLVSSLATEDGARRRGRSAWSLSSLPASSPIRFVGSSSPGSPRFALGAVLTVGRVQSLRLIDGERGRAAGGKGGLVRSFAACGRDPPGDLGGARHVARCVVCPFSISDGVQSPQNGTEWSIGRFDWREAIR